MDTKPGREVPKDTFRMVYIIFFWLGIGTLLPWNMFITVNAYWDQKFRNVTASSNGTIISEETEDLTKLWPGYLSVASMVPNVLFLILNGVFGHRLKTQPRLLVSLAFVILLFIFTSVMVQIDTDLWQSTFLYVTLASVVFININAAIFQGGILGVAGKFPPSYMGAVFSGQAVGGIFASVSNVIFLAVGASPTQAAFFCFVLSVIFLATAMVAYAFVTKSEFYKFYLGETPQPTLDDHKLLDGSADHKSKIPVKVNPLTVMLDIWPYGVAVLMCFLVTLGCFPALTVRVVSTVGEGPWANKFFIPVSCFVLFNVGDYLGRQTAEWVQWPKPGKKESVIVLALSLLRIGFLPLFLLCNLSPGERTLFPVVFESDTAYILIMAAFSLSNGYIGSICMMSAPQTVREAEAQTAASLMVALLGIGLGTGAFLSNFCVLLLN
jgi:equilibrative nucleoside transporter 1/2/3